MRWNLSPEKQYRTSDRLARIPSKVIFTILLQVGVKRLMDKNCHSSFSFLKNNGFLLAFSQRRLHYWSQQSRTFFFKGFSAKEQKKLKKAANYSVIEQNALSDKHPKMTGQNDRPDESLTGQPHDQAGHCPLTGRYFEPCDNKKSRTRVQYCLAMV